MRPYRSSEHTPLPTDTGPQRCRRLKEVVGGRLILCVRRANGLLRVRVNDFDEVLRAIDSLAMTAKHKWQRR